MLTFIAITAAIVAGVLLIKRESDGLMPKGILYGVLAIVGGMLLIVVAVLLIILIICLLFWIFSGKKSIKEKLWQDVRRMLEDSHIQYDLLEDNDTFFIFPKGAKELDNALVSQPLEWLSNYPKSESAFVKALKLYADSSDLNASDVAEAFRKSLETFFQEFFNSDKSLENLKSEYGQFLKNCNVPAEISNNFQSLLNSYALFMNNYAKHHNKTSKNVLEYIMYQTGNIIRLLITLKLEENS